MVTGIVGQAAAKRLLPKMKGQTVEDEANYHEMIAWRLAHDVLLGYPT
jgi:hypothetical protein